MTPDSDDDVIILSPPKKGKMDVSNRVNASPFIKIEQIVKHDVWDLRKKNDGAFVMKKLNESHATGTDTNNSGLCLNAGSTWMNPEQFGARPKVTVQVPKQNLFTINAVNTPKDVVDVSKNSVITANLVNVPKNEVHVIKTNSFITVNPVNTPKSGSISVSTQAAPPKEVIIINTAGAPTKEVITINPYQMPKKNVITLKMPTASKKDVITVKTENSNMEVITINTAKSPKQNEVWSSQTYMDVEQQFKKDIQNIQGNQGSAMSLDPASNNSPSSNAVSSGYASFESTPIYTDEACRIQEMFPEITLNAISEDLSITGSVDGTIENILEKRLKPPMFAEYQGSRGDLFGPSSRTTSTEYQDSQGGLLGPSSCTTSVVSQNSQSELSRPSNSTALSSGSSVIHHVDKEAVPQQSTKTGNVSATKKAGTFIKIELLEQNEVWDIRKKEEQGYVMKKVVPDVDLQSRSNKPVYDSSCRDNLTEPMEEEFDELLSTDIFVDDMPYKGNRTEVDAPVKLMMVSSKCSSKNSQDSKRAIAVPDEEKMEASIQVHNLNNDPGDKESLKSFDFSDDENEEGETIEHFLFKASLELKKRRYLCEAANQDHGDSALLNITGVVKDEEENESAAAEEGCSMDEDDEYYTDECCTDEED